MRKILVGAAVLTAAVFILQFENCGSSGTSGTGNYTYGAFTIDTVTPGESAYYPGALISATAALSLNNSNIYCYWTLSGQGQYITYPTTQSTNSECVLSNGQSPTTVGNYTLSLVATDNAGDTMNTSGTIVISTSGSSGGSTTSTGYSSLVVHDIPSFYWQLSDGSGNQVSSTVGTNTAYLDNSVGLGAPGPFANATSITAASFSGGMIYTSLGLSAPQTFSIEAWFQTTSQSGGDIVGYGNNQVPIGCGSCSGYTHDRMVFMDNSGHIIFSVYNGNHTSISTSGTYNNGAWHHVVATIGSTGMYLFMDGAQVASGGATSAENANGFWHIGYEYLGDWDAGNVSQYNFTGSIAQVAIYNLQLTATQVSNHYTTGKSD